MKSPKPYFYFGSCLLLLTGLGDLIATDFLRSVLLEIEGRDRVFGLMAETDVSFLGLHTTLMGVYDGFSLGTGFLLFVFGVMNLVVAWVAPEALFRSRPILALDAGTSLVLLVISVNRFPSHGIVIFTLALIAFLTALILQEIGRASAKT